MDIYNHFFVYKSKKIESNAKKYLLLCLRMIKWFSIFVDSHFVIK